VSSEDYKHSEALGNSRTLGMTRFRVILLSTVSFLLIIGSLLSIIRDEEYWPFSPYPMFSGVNRTPYSSSTLQLYGVTQEEPHDEILIPTDRGDYIQPFEPSMFLTALKRIQSENNPKRSSRLLNKALLDSLKRYEKFRLAGRHDGPPLQGLRLYRVKKGDPEAGVENVDRPDDRKLIAEAEQG
jgi:hypothetical protein